MALTYKLRATRAGRSKEIDLPVDLETYEAKRTLSIGGGADDLAVMDAIPVIMNRATADPLWAKGRIVLTAPDGRVVQEMEEK